MAVESIEALSLISQQFPDDPVVFTCGASCREIAAVERRDNHFLVVEAMGLVSPIVLGISLGLEGDSQRRVVGVVLSPANELVRIFEVSSQFDRRLFVDFAEFSHHGSI